MMYRMSLIEDVDKGIKGYKGLFMHIYRKKVKKGGGTLKMHILRLRPSRPRKRGGVGPRAGIGKKRKKRGHSIKGYTNFLIGTWTVQDPPPPPPVFGYF